MEKRFRDEKILKEVGENRRDFMKKVIVGTAFAAPVIYSFSMDGLKIRMGVNQACADTDDKKGFDIPGPDKKPGVAPGPRPKPTPSPFK